MKQPILYLTILIITFSCSNNTKETQGNANAMQTVIESKAMQNQNFSTTLLVENTPSEVFNAINNVQGWWSEEIEGNTSNLNDEFSYHYKDVHICKMKLIEVIPNEKIVWLVLENYFNFTKDTTEWINTKICFEISREGKQTKLRFTHLGLVPEYECYNICKDAWGNYIHNSLKNLITTGKGLPNPKEGGFNEQILKEHKIQ